MTSRGEWGGGRGSLAGQANAGSATEPLNCPAPALLNHAMQRSGTAYIEQNQDFLLIASPKGRRARDYPGKYCQARLTRRNSTWLY